MPTLSLWKEGTTVPLILQAFPNSSTTGNTTVLCQQTFVPYAWHQFQKCLFYHHNSHMLPGYYAYRIFQLHRRKCVAKIYFGFQQIKEPQKLLPIGQECLLFLFQNYLILKNSMTNTSAKMCCQICKGLIVQNCFAWSWRVQVYFLYITYQL